MRSKAALSLALSLGSACVLHEEFADPPTATSIGESGLSIDCSGLPPYDLPSLDCAQLGNAFESTLRAASACNGPADCQLIRPRCETWGEVACYYAANYCVGPRELDRFAAEAEGCTAGNESCDCEEEPIVDCVNRSCVLISAY
jgi:hypothetical protein